jgi:adenylate kinase family enzyme
MVDKVLEALLEADVKVTEDEIKALASISNKCNANIFEIVEGNNYRLMIKYEDDNEEQILISSQNLEDYKSAVKEFYSLFIKHGGQLTIDEIFMSEEEELGSKVIDAQKALAAYESNKTSKLLN